MTVRRSSGFSTVPPGLGSRRRLTRQSMPTMGFAVTMGMSEPPDEITPRSSSDFMGKAYFERSAPQGSRVQASLSTSRIGGWAL